MILTLFNREVRDKAAQKKPKKHARNKVKKFFFFVLKMKQHFTVPWP